MNFALLYIQVFFGIAHVIWCEPQGVQVHRNWRLLPHNQCGHRSTALNQGPIDITKLPWIGKLYVQNVISRKYRLLCGVSVINNRYVLSAAHCVAFYNKKYLSVGLGGTFMFKDDLQINVESFTIHPKYSTCESEIADSFKNDISLIRLAKQIHFKGNIQPICLPSNIDVKMFGPNTTMEIAGWGDQLKLDGSKSLQHKNVTILPKFKCSAKGVRSLIHDPKAAAKLKGVNLKCLTPLDQTQLCASEGTRKYAYGAPLMKSVTISGKPTYFIFGITSYNVKNVATTFTAVHEFIKWIIKQIKP